MDLVVVHLGSPQPGPPVVAAPPMGQFDPQGTWNLGLWGFRTTVLRAAPASAAEAIEGANGAGTGNVLGYAVGLGWKPAPTRLAVGHMCDWLWGAAEKAADAGDAEKAKEALASAGRLVLIMGSAALVLGQAEALYRVSDRLINAMGAGAGSDTHAAVPVHECQGMWHALQVAGGTEGRGTPADVTSLASAAASIVDAAAMAAEAMTHPSAPGTLARGRTEIPFVLEIGEPSAQVMCTLLRRACLAGDSHDVGSILRLVGGLVTGLRQSGVDHEVLFDVETRSSAMDGSEDEITREVGMQGADAKNRGNGGAL